MLFHASLFSATPGNTHILLTETILLQTKAVTNVSGNVKTMKIETVSCIINEN
jgi:hypothetical protein